MKNQERRHFLNEACRNEFGYFDAAPGTDVCRRLMDSGCPEIVISRYVKLGWLRRVGSGLVLTSKGYQSC